jgi:hypothetical protein
MIDLKKICSLLESKRCKEHHEKPKAIVKGSSINFTSCCDKFQNELQTIIKTEISKQTQDAIKKIFKK